MTLYVHTFQHSKTENMNPYTCTTTFFSFIFDIHMHINLHHTNLLTTNTNMYAPSLLLFEIISDFIMCNIDHINVLVTRYTHVCQQIRTGKQKQRSTCIGFYNSGIRKLRLQLNETKHEITKPK